MDESGWKNLISLVQRPGSLDIPKGCSSLNLDLVIVNYMVD
jgi:hypothetical protein